MDLMESTTIEDVIDNDNITKNCTLEGILGSCEIKDYIDYSVMVLVGINAMGIGGHIDGDRMIVLLTKPFLVSVGMFLRFGVLPAIGLGLAELFQLQPEVAIGTLALLLAPHEGISNLMVALLDGDLTASMAIAGVNNFTTCGGFAKKIVPVINRYVAFLPLWAMIYEYQVYGFAGVITLPIREIFIVFGYISTMATIGLFLRTKCGKCYDKYWELLPAFTVVTIIYVIVIEIFLQFMTLRVLSLKIVAMSVIITTTGFLIGALTGYILRQTQQITIVLSVEMGVRTTYITSLVSSMSFVGQSEDNTKIVPFLSSILSIMPVLVLVLGVRFFRTKSVFKKYFNQVEEVDGICSTPEQPLCNNKDYNIA